MQGFGELGVVAAGDAGQEPGGHGELRGLAGVGIEQVAERGVDPFGHSWNEQAVQQQGGRVGAGRAAAPQLPVQQPQLWGEQIFPVQVAVYGFPLPNMQLGTEGVAGALGDPRLIGIHPTGGDGPQGIDAAPQLSPPGVRQVNSGPELVGGRDCGAGQQLSGSRVVGGEGRGRVGG